MYEFVRVVLVFGITFKPCLFLRTRWGSKRNLRSLNTNIVDLANEGHGEHRASRGAGDGAHWGGEGGNFTRTEAVARWSR